MLTVSCLLFVAFYGHVTQAGGAGRAFPIDGENFVIEEFKRINPSIEWDPTNFLVDLSGNYANCNYLGKRGIIPIEKKTPEGSTIIGITDYTDGSGTDVDSVNSYIRQVIDGWTRSGSYNYEIRTAEKFGCSVRPGCRGQVSVSCLFSKARSASIIQPPRPEQPIHNPGGDNDALAFTVQQYDLAEKITGNKWDRSHFLENLSGYETDCAMIGSKDWTFAKATEMGRQNGLKVFGAYGYERNRGGTEDALVKILSGFKQIPYASKAGCSVIPDCMSGRDMYVVVSCLYEEY